MSSQEEGWLLEEKYHGEKSEAFFTDLVRLQNGEPLAYLIGSIPFLNCLIHLDSRPLIPRPETEYWVEKVISEIKQNKSSNQIKVLDLCAGSGCIGIAIAKAIPEVHIDFIELEPQHLPTIKMNCLENKIEDSRFHILQGDLFKVSDETPLDKYDYIISNPPYIDPVLDRTESSVKKYEPGVALYGGKNGIELIEKIIAEAPLYLNPGGQLWLEHEPEQIEEIKENALKHFKCTSHLDQYQVMRFSQLMLQ